MQRLRHLRPARRATTIVGYLAVLGTVIASLFTIGIALAARAPTPTPSITRRSGGGQHRCDDVGDVPFTDTASPVTYQCSMDSTSSYSSLHEPEDLQRAWSTAATRSGSPPRRPARTRAPPRPAQWTINTTPPAPTITSGPSGTVASSSASFTYTDTQAGVTFQCKLDTGNFAVCPTAGTSYTALADGPHTFSVAAKATGSPLGAATSRTLDDQHDAARADDHVRPDRRRHHERGDVHLHRHAGRRHVPVQARHRPRSPRARHRASTYGQLADGLHTFQVAAKSATSPLGAAASRTWTVDRKPPTFAVTFPANNGIYRASTWNAGCTPVGICGSAADATGVGSVGVAIYQTGTPTFVNATLAAPGATSTGWKFTRALPADGTYNLRVQRHRHVGQHDGDW